MRRAFYDQAPAIELRKYDPTCGPALGRDPLTRLVPCAQCHLTLTTPDIRLVAEVTLDEQEMRDALSSGFRQVRSRARHVLAFTSSFKQVLVQHLMAL